MSDILTTVPVRYKVILEGEVTGVPEPMVGAWLMTKMMFSPDFRPTVRIGVAPVGPDPKIIGQS